MARIRSIHPSACTSEKLALCTGDEERCYWRLQTHCDDEGRAEDHPRLIWAALFPLNEDVAPTDVDRWLDGLESRGLIVRYEVLGKAYLCILGWAEKQSPRHPTPSKFPPMPEDYGDPPQRNREAQEDSADAPQGEGVDVGGGVGGRAAARESFSEDFDAWWVLYPRKIDKEPARKAYIARRRAGVSALDLVHAVENYSEASDGQEREHIKYAKTFLNGSWSEWVDGVPADAKPVMALVNPFGDGVDLGPTSEPEPWVCDLGDPECRGGYVVVDHRETECECRRQRVRA